MLRARYVHTNLVASDWRRLARFYVDLFGCVPVPPERDYGGDALDRLTSLTDSRLTGMHLRLPGYGDDGPTLEIFAYSPPLPASQPQPNRQGYGHIAFAVDDVRDARDRVLASGGAAIGEVVRFVVGDGRVLDACYVTDPENNIVELQSWSVP